MPTGNSMSAWRLLTDTGHNVLETVYFDFNVLVPPLDVYYPRVEARIEKCLAALGRSPMRWLGTGFLLKAVRSDAGAAMVQPRGMLEGRGRAR